MKYRYLVIAGLMLLYLPTVNAEELVMSTPNSAVTLPMKGRKGSSFFTVNGARYNVVIAFTVGSDESEELIRQVVQLSDGQSYQVSIGGFGSDTTATTLKLTRKDKVVVAKIVSCESREKISDCI